MKHLSRDTGSRADSALLVIDMERGFLDADSSLCIRGAAETLPACGRVIDYARETGIPVFFVIRAYRSDGSDAEATRYAAWHGGGKLLAPGSAGPGSVETPPEVTPRPGDYVIWKPRFSAFFQTELDLILRRLGVRALYLAGTTTPNCIRTTCYDALSLDYNVAVLTDCTSANTEEIHQSNLRDMANIGAVLLTGEAFRAGERVPDLTARVREQVLADDTPPEPV